MSAAVPDDWTSQFGLAHRQPPSFFRSLAALEAMTPPPPQTHAMRRAFIELELDGIVCFANAPTVYFKKVDDIATIDLRELQRRVWNQGLAPVLVVVDGQAAHIYSGLALPAAADAAPGGDGRLVETLDRVTQAIEIRQAMLGLETGEYFRLHAKSFDPERRVDRQLLNNLGAARTALTAVSPPDFDTQVLDALLCRLVFTCYLVDRHVIGADYLAELGPPGVECLLNLFRDRPAARPSAAVRPRADRLPRDRSPADARRLLYKLFLQLQPDFNGDLFSADLIAERDSITDEHIQILTRFLAGERFADGQTALNFWAYDFSLLPIETISAIYEDFLRAGAPATQRATGAYYTPRFLAEVVLDTALDGLDSLLTRRFLDPACGSGIFLVGIFHRLAEEWRRQHPDAPYDEHADALIDILRRQLFGIDRNVTACRIAAFSLYLGLLDQLGPPDIRKLQARGRWLPKLVFRLDTPQDPKAGRTILHADFAEADSALPVDGVDVIVGNPPWVSRTASGEAGGASPEPNPPMLEWCAGQVPPLPIAQKQLAYGFIWKAPRHLRAGGRVCFLLPYGVLFNHDPKAIKVQQQWYSTHALERIVNLSDLRFLLFEGAIKPAVIVRYRGTPPTDREKDKIEYFAPKVDVGVLRADLLVLAPDDRVTVQLRQVFADLAHDVPPSVWKERLWGTPRDSKFLERLAVLPRLGAITGRHGQPPKRWMIGQGFQPLGPNDDPDPERTKDPWPPETLFIDANDPRISLLLLESDARKIKHEFGRLRRNPESQEIFAKPHVLVSKGLRVAFADFDVVFRHALQGIHGPQRDTSLLMFLAAYLQSPLARYFLFHTAANWGAERPEVHLSELLCVPFPLPADAPKPKRAREIVGVVAKKMRSARRKIEEQPLFRQARQPLIDGLASELRPLIDEYFDVGSEERLLVDDTFKMALPSATPRRKNALEIPSLLLTKPPQRDAYVKQLLDVLNDWAKRGSFRFRARVIVAHRAGLGVVHLWRVAHDAPPAPETVDESTADSAMNEVLQKVGPRLDAHRGVIMLARGVTVFSGPAIHLLKPLTGRFWTPTAALNDADEIAAAILERKPGGGR